MNEVVKFKLQPSWLARKELEVHKNSCLDSRLTDDGKIVSLMHRPRSTLQKHYFSAFGTYFC
jgi:hypothetical protein